MLQKIQFLYTEYTNRNTGEKKKKPWILWSKYVNVISEIKSCIKHKLNAVKEASPWSSGLRKPGDTEDGIFSRMMRVRGLRATCWEINTKWETRSELGLTVRLACNRDIEKMDGKEKELNKVRVINKEKRWYLIVYFLWE